MAFLFLCTPNLINMQTFPVISSTVSAKHIGFFVQQQYGLKETAKCSLLKAGVNHSYLVTVGNDKFVFRLYSVNWRTELDITEEIRLLNLLRDAKVSVSYPLEDAAGKYIQQITAPEGLRYGVLFSFAEGDKQLNFSADLHRQAGETMARIHQVTHNLHLQRVTYTLQVILQDPFVHLGQFLPKESEEMAWMLSAHKYLLQVLANADATQMRTGVVHLDIWFDNFTIDKEGKITIFDFDFCGNGWLCYDIAYYILQVYSTEKVPAERDEKIAGFFEGYESITAITAEEKRLLPALGVSLYFFYLGVQCQRFEDWSNVFINETYLKRFINILVKKYFEDNVSGELLTGNTN